MINFIKLATPLFPVVLSMSVFACGKKDDNQQEKVKVELTVDRGEGNALNLADSASVTSLKLCFKRLRFKAEEADNEESTEEADDADSNNIDFELGEVDVLEEASLGTVEVTEGSYRRIEVDLDKKCSGKSVSLVNAQGDFSSDERIKMKFRGEFDVSESKAKIGLAFDAIVANLVDVAADVGIRDALQDPSGVAMNK